MRLAYCSDFGEDAADAEAFDAEPLEVVREVFGVMFPAANPIFTVLGAMVESLED
jgi:hypothetical protein